MEKAPICIEVLDAVFLSFRLRLPLLFWLHVLPPLFFHKFRQVIDKYCIDQLTIFTPVVCIYCGRIRICVLYRFLLALRRQ